MGSLGAWVFSAVSSLVLAWASHHPQFHDLALWGLGVLGTHFGHQVTKAQNGSGG